MKTRSTFPCLLAAALFTCAIPARAESKPADPKAVEKIDQGGVWKPGDNDAGPDGPRDGRMREEIMKRFDKNGDGKLDEAERAEFEKARAGAMKNGGPAAGGGRMQEEIIKRFDKDGDGKLNAAEQAEFEKAKAERMKNAGPAGGGRMREEIIKRFDKDGDGKLNEAEEAEARKAMEQRRAGGGKRPDAK